MTLFLHIGTEKTGSSFLQTTAARNREVLSRTGIHFPEAGKRESDMLKGRVSPGNGKALFTALKSKDANAVIEILQNAFHDAAKQKCDSVLFSNENLVELYVVDGAVELLQKISDHVGIKKIKAFLMLRSPTDQALSLYKHRAKSGAVKDVAEWIEHDFHTMKILDGFVSKCDSVGIEHTVHKYSKNSTVMCDVFFKQWLGVLEPVIFKDELVNPSLTLSELLFLKAQFSISPRTVAHYYEAFLTIPKEKKGDDQDIENAYRQVISEKLSKHQATVTLLNRHLPENEKLDEAKISISTSVTQRNFAPNLSDYQLHVVKEKERYLNSPIGRLKLWVEYFKIKLATRLS